MLRKGTAVSAPHLALETENDGVTRGEHSPDWGVDGVRALRAALKTLLRRYGLKCLSVEETKYPNQQGDGDA
jgi:hypothetical protein